MIGRAPDIGHRLRPLLDAAPDPVIINVAGVGNSAGQIFWDDADTQTGAYHGLWQRISITVGFGYFGVLAIGLLRRHGRGAEGGPRPFSRSPRWSG